VDTFCTVETDSRMEYRRNEEVTEGVEHILTMTGRGSATETYSK